MIHEILPHLKKLQSEVLPNSIRHHTDGLREADEALLTIRQLTQQLQHTSAEQALRDALEAMGSKTAQSLSSGELSAVVSYVDYDMKAPR